jgi:hypothetical protein
MPPLSYATPIRELISEADLPVDFITTSDPSSASLLDKLFFTDSSVTVTNDGIGMLLELVVTDEIVLSLPGLDAVSIVVGGGADKITRIRASFFLSDAGFRIRLDDIKLGLRFSSEILKPVAEDPSTPVPPFVQIEATGAIAMNERFDISVEGFRDLSLPPVMIGSSGIIISAQTFKLDLSRTETLPEIVAAGFDESFVGVFLGKATVKFPEGWSALPDDLAFENCAIGSGGFTGKITAYYFDEVHQTFTRPPSDLFGIPFRLKHVLLELRQNAFVQSQILGQVLLPFFENWVEVDIGLDLGGGFHVRLADANAKGLKRIETKAFSLELDSLAFEVKDGLFIAKVSGQLTPTFGGLKWPAFDVKELSIDSKGNVHLEGGWLDLPKQYTLNLYGFKLEISKLGFGKTEDGGQFIGFSGGLKLVDGMPAGASVEGLRIVWYPNGDTSLTLKGVGVEFRIPGVLHFKGAVSYDDAEKRFTGDIKLEIVTPKLTVDGTLVIGTAIGNQGKYTYFAIYLDADLPGGIVLGSTGLSIYGMAGLFALQMEPDKKPDDKWFSLDHDHSWYHRGKRGVTDIVNKWQPRKGSVALGAGLTLATTVDNGYSFNGKFMLVLVFPGPIIMLQGSANLLKKRSEATEDALFRALAVFDGRESTVLIGLDAEYKTGKQGQMIEIQAGAEAFYSFNDPSAWYLNLGKDEPRSQRIRALFGRFVEVDAYFMLNAHRLALGAWYGLNRHWDVGPLSITLQAWADGNVLVSFKPSQFHGDLWIHGAVDLDIFGFGLGLTVDARIAADLFTPFHLLGEFSVKINLPWPLDDVGASVTLEWGIRPDPPPIPLPLQDVSIEHLKSTIAWPLKRGELLLANNADADGFVIDVPQTPGEPSVAIPVVPVDARPHLTFARPMHDVAGVGVNGQEPLDWETIGDPSRGGQTRARYSLQSLVLARKTGNIWTPVASAPHSGTERALFGSWAALPASPGGDPGKSAQTKLWLWNLDPFAFLRRSGSSWEEWFAASFPGYPCVPELAAEEVCFGFDALAPGTTVKSPWTHPGAPEVTLSWGFGPATVGTRTVTAGRVTRQVNLLCFPDAAARSGVQIRSAEPSRSFRILLADASPRPAPAAEAIQVIPLRVIGTIDAVPATCVEVRQQTAGTVANPWSQDGVRFTVRGADGGFLPVGRIERWGTGELGLNAGFELDIDLPCSSSWVELIVTHRPPFRIVAFDAKGTAVATHAPQGTGGEVTETIRLEGSAMTRLVVHASGNEKLVHEVCFACDQPVGPYSSGYDDHGVLHGPFIPVGHTLTIDVPLPTVVVTSDGAFCLEQICVTPDREAGALVRREEKIDHIREELSRWSDEAPVLEPNTEYQLTIKTRAELEGVRAWDLTENAYFRTEGPPGLVTLTVPEGTQKETFDSGLEDLTRYVGETDPPTVPSPGEKPLLFRPFYRAYDVGVEFNESYVETMYRMDRRDLGLYLFNASNQPARDSRGKLLALTNRWGKSGTLTLSESETHWITLIDSATCLSTKLDPRTFPHDNTLASTEPDRVLAPDTLYEARLVPLLFHETFVGGKPGDRPDGWYADDAGPGGSSLWRVMEVGEPPSRYVEQTEKIGGAVEPDRPGTVLLLADPGSAGWTDYRLSVYVRSAAGGAVGVVFRHGGPGSWYRFALHERFRRLVKADPAGAKILAEDHTSHQRNRDYLLTVETIGDSLRTYVDGEPVFEVTDGTFKTGRIGLYTCQSPGARFTDVRVDDLGKMAPVVYRFQFTTSLYANFFHHLDSYQDETWPFDLGTEPVPGEAAPLSFTPPSESEARAYETLADKVLGAAARQNPARVEVTRLKRTDQPPAFLLRSPEPLDWKRVELEVSRSGRRLLAPSFPGALKLTDVSFGASKPEEEMVSLLLREAADLTRHRVELWDLPGPIQQPAGDPVLLLESFRSEAALERFTIIDKGDIGGPSHWLVEGGALLQISGIRGGNEPELPGTLAVIGDMGATEWTHYRLTVDLRSDSDGAIGVVFRYRDENNYYRLSLDTGLRYRRLVKIEDGQVTILWEKEERGFSVGEPFRLVLEAVGPRLTGLIDGARIFEVVDATHANGRVGLYTSNNPAARCEHLEVRRPSLEALAWLRDRFAEGDLTGWSLVSETGAPLPQAAAWEVSDGALRLRSLLAEGGSPGYPGVYAVAGEPGWTDTIVSVRLRSPEGAGGAIGLLFRGANLQNYYRFSMSRLPAYRQLVKKAGGQTTVLWRDDVAYPADRSMELTIVAVGSSLRGYLDGVPLFAVEDHDVLAGRIGLYAWNNPEAWFSSVRVWPAGHTFDGWLLDEAFDTPALDGWSLLDDPASWRVESGELSHQPPPSAWPELEGGVDGTVHAIALSGGDVFVGGEITVAGGVPARGIASWDGVTWRALGSGVNGSVRAIVVQGDQVYVGGLFIEAGGTPARNVAVWDRSKRTWSAIGDGVNGPVFALALAVGRLYVGGQFNRAGTMAVGNVTARDLAARSWSNLGGGVNSSVLALAVQGKNVYLGGQFTQAGGKPASKVARWNGSAWMAGGGVINGPVTAVALGETDIYVGGGFTQAGGVAANRIARWTGAGWSPLGAGLDGQVQAIVVAGHQVWVAGHFTQAGSAQASRVARWSRFASAWSAVGGGLDGAVRAIAVDEEAIHVGGAFTSPAHRIARMPRGGNGYAVSGEAGVDAFRLAARLRPGADGAVAVLFRWQDQENHDALWLDAERGARRLIQTRDGVAKTLWQDAVRPVAGREHAVTIDVLGGRLTGYLDGVELFSFPDPGTAVGRAGFVARRSSEARFAELRIAVPAWVLHHSFGEEDLLPAGTRIQLRAGGKAPSSAGLGLRSAALAGEQGSLRLRPCGAALRIVSPDGRPGHSRSFLPESERSAVSTAVLRKADSTGLFLFPTSSGAEASFYSLLWTYHRDRKEAGRPFSQAGSCAPERVRIDLF